jgi:hypothetical protein
MPRLAKYLSSGNVKTFSLTFYASRMLVSPAEKHHHVVEK